MSFNKNLRQFVLPALVTATNLLAGCTETPQPSPQEQACQGIEKDVRTELDKTMATDMCDPNEERKRFKLLEEKIAFLVDMQHGCFGYYESPEGTLKSREGHFRIKELRDEKNMLEAGMQKKRLF